MKEIELHKKYKTRNNDDVIIYSVTVDNEDYTVHGAYKYEGDWLIESWTCDGFSYGKNDPNGEDLIEIKIEETDDELVFDIKQVGNVLIAKGLTKREYFAGLAMQAVITGGVYENPVQVSIAYADELIKELNK